MGIVIATLKEEQGIQVAYILRGMVEERFMSGSIDFSVALNTQMLIEAVLHAHPGALFVTNEEFDKRILHEGDEVDHLNEEFRRTGEVGVITSVHPADDGVSVRFPDGEHPFLKSCEVKKVTR